MNMQNRREWEFEKIKNKLDFDPQTKINNKRTNDVIEKKEENKKGNGDFESRKTGGKQELCGETWKFSMKLDSIEFRKRDCVRDQVKVEG